jgi:lipopolysaccharide/colanic/teichoic acid biosynthesis glycosyltransferase
LLLTTADAVAATSAVVLAAFAWTFTSGDEFTAAFLRERAWWLFVVPLWTAALQPSRQRHAALDLRITIVAVLRASAWLFGLYLAAFFYFGTQVLPRLMAVYVLWNSLWLTLLARVVVLFIVTRGRFSRRLLVLGDEAAAATVRRLAAAPALADAVVIDATDPNPTDVVVALPTPLPTATTERLLRYQEAGVTVTTLEQLYELTLLRVPVQHVSDRWLLVEMFGGRGLRDASPLLKRGFDLVVAVSLSVLTLPVSLLAVILILALDRGPVFYRQERLGQGGRPFSITKFRTMAVDAEKDGPQWSGEADERVTRSGRWLRRTHIDELPNLWHVLRGEMSMVGPRPERPAFVESLSREIPWYRARLVVRPGLTGWAQVNQGYSDSVKAAREKLEFDLYYIRHQSIWFDLAIVVRTVWRTLGLRGR